MTPSDASPAAPFAPTALVGRCPACREPARRFDTDPELVACRTCGTLLPAEALTDAALETPAPARFGRHLLLEQVGAGASAEVWKAWDTLVGRTVALKIARAPAAVIGEAERARLARESAIAARLRHPHLVPLLDVLVEGERPALVLEFVHGPSLAARLQAGPPPPAPVAARWIRDVALALDHLHALGVVHRDIKPGNLLLDPAAAADAPGGFSIRLADFGLARLASDPRLTLPIHTVGTPAYMPPERFAPGPADDARGDLYSLGSVLHEALTGRPPFEGVGEELVRAILHAPTPDPRRWRPELPRDLAAIVARRLEKSPARRYATAAELAADLTRWLEGRPTLARPLGPVARLARWTVRQPLTASLVATLILTLAGFGMVSTAQWRRAERAAAEAVRQREAAETLAAVARWQQSLAEEAAAQARRQQAAAEALARELRSQEEATSRNRRDSRVSRDERQTLTLGALAAASAVLDRSLPLAAGDPAGADRLRELDALFAVFAPGRLRDEGQLLALAEIYANRALVVASLGRPDEARFLAEAAAEALAQGRTRDIGAVTGEPAPHEARLRVVEERVRRAQAVAGVNNSAGEPVVRTYP